MAQKNGLEAVKALMKLMTETNSFSRVMQKMRVVSGEEGRVVCELDVEEEHTNPFGTLHGGLTATLIDQVTTMALVSSKRAEPGVSVNLNVSYLRPAPIGETILVDATVSRVGKTLGFTTADIRRKSDGELVAQGQHTKAFPS